MIRSRAIERDHSSDVITPRASNHSGSFLDKTHNSDKTPIQDKTILSDKTSIYPEKASVQDSTSIQDNTSLDVSDDSDDDDLDQIIRDLDPHGGVTPPALRSRSSSVTGIADCHHHQRHHQGGAAPANGNSKASSRDGSRRSGSTRDSLLSPSKRVLEQGEGRYPRRTDFGDHYPDGGWGWVVCGAMFVVHFLAHGLHLAAGTLIEEMTSEFGISESYAVWICSISYSVSSMLSPVVVTICRRKSPRLLALIGGLVTSLACLFMSFSRLDQQLAVSMAAVLPIGSGMALTTASLMLARYFRKRRECAEMLALCGSGVGMAVVSVFQAQVFSTLNWMRAMQALSGLMIPILLAGSVYRSPTIYHPRRKVILHLKTLTKTKKQRKEFENKPPYFDFSPLRMRIMHVLLTSTAVINLGTYVPFVLLPKKATNDKISKPSYNLLMVFLGVAFAFGCLMFGLIIVRSSVRCMISRQYLVQLTSLGCGVSTLLFSLAHQFDGYALYVWVYGLCCGGYTYSLRMYTYEQVTVKLAERTAGYVTFVQGLPVLFGVPLARWLDDVGGSTDNRYGFVFSGSCMLLGGAILLLMPWASKHRSNWEVVQSAHLKGAASDDVILYDMNVSDHTNSDPRKPTDPSARPCHANAACCPEVEQWPNIEAMTPMSAADKVTEFLVHSQNMLQSFSRMHSIELPSVKLEINNQYTIDPELAQSGDQIKDLTLQATVCRNSPRAIAVRCRPSVTTGSDVIADSPPIEEAPTNPALDDVDSAPEVELSAEEQNCRQPLANHARAIVQSRDCEIPGEKTTTV